MTIGGPHLEALRKGQLPGRCCICEEQLRGQRRRVCTDEECTRAYLSELHRDQYWRIKQGIHSAAKAMDRALAALAGTP